MDSAFRLPSQVHKILRPIVIASKFGPETAALILYWVIGLAPASGEYRQRRPSCPAFIGRKAALSQLHAGLQRSPIVAIVGTPNLAGIGKTELAIQYAQKYEADYPGGVFWLEGLAALQELQPPPESLLVLEDIAEVGPLAPYFAAGHTVRVVVTVRAKRAAKTLLAAIPHRVEIGVLSEEETLEFWEHRLPGTRLLASPEGRELALLIGEWLGALPLSLDLAAQYLLDQPELSLTDFLQQLQPKWLNHQLIDEGATLAVNAQRGLRAILDLSYERLSIEAQMLGNLLSLLAPTPIPWDLVEQMVLPLIQSIWLDVMQMDFCQGTWTGAEQDWQRFLEQMQAIWIPAREELGRSHLLIELEGDQVRLHPCVQAFFQEQLHHQPDAPLYPQAVIHTLLGLTQGGMGSSLAVLVPHLIEISHTLTEFLNPADQVGLWLKLAEFYEGEAALDLSALWQSKALDVLKQMLSGQQLDMALSLLPRFPTEPGLILAHPEPELWMEPGGTGWGMTPSHVSPELPASYALDRIPDYSPQSLPDHPPHALSDHPLAPLSNYAPDPSHIPAPEPSSEPPLDPTPDLALSPLLLAHLDGWAEEAAQRYAEGHYAAAGGLYQQMIDLIRQQAGPAHPAAAVGLSHLAKVYLTQKRYDEAEGLYLEALELRYATFGESHADVATSLHDLAYLYEMQELWEEAEPLYVKALELRQRLLEDFHPDVVTSMTNLAHLYEAQHRYRSAETLYRQALRLLKRRSGSQHPDVATGLNNLAYLYESQRRYDKAAMLYQQALELRQRLLGPDHPDVATSLNNLAAVSMAQGKYRQAEQFYVQAVEISDRTLGADHANTVIFRENLQIFRRDQRSRPADPGGILSRIFSR